MSTSRSHTSFKLVALKADRMGLETTCRMERASNIPSFYIAWALSMKSTPSKFSKFWETVSSSWYPLAITIAIYLTVTENPAARLTRSPARQAQRAGGGSLTQHCKHQDDAAMIANPGNSLNTVKLRC